MDRAADPTMTDAAQFHFALNNVRVRMGLVWKTIAALEEDDRP